MFVNKERLYAHPVYEDGMGYKTVAEAKLKVLQSSKLK